MNTQKEVYDAIDKSLDDIYKNAIKKFDGILESTTKKGFTKITQVTLCQLIIENKWTFDDVEDSVVRFSNRHKMNPTVIFNTITQHKDKAHQQSIQDSQEALKSSVGEELNTLDKQIDQMLFTWNQVTKRPHEITKAFDYRVYRDVDTSDYIIMSQTGQADVVIYKKTKEALQAYLNYKINPVLHEEEEEFQMIVEYKAGNEIESLNFKHAEFDRLVQVRPTFDPINYGGKIVQPDKFHPMVDSLNSFSPTPLMNMPKIEDEVKLLPLTKSFYMNLYGSEEAFDWMMNWFSCIYQTNTKSIRSPLIISAEGAGKGLSYQMIEQIYKNYCFMDDKSEIFSATFNGELANKLFCFLDELNIFDMEKKAYKNLKGWMASNYKFNANFKNGYKGQYPLFANFVAFTNDDTPIELTEGDRRWNVFRSTKPLDKCNFLVNDNAEETALTLLNKEHIENLALFFSNYPINMKHRNKKIKNKEYHRLLEDSGDKIIPIWTALKNKDMEWFEEEGIDLYKYKKSNNEYGMNMKIILEKCFAYNKMPLNFFQQLINDLGSKIQKPKDIQGAIKDFPSIKTIYFIYKDETDPIRLRGFKLCEDEEVVTMVAAKRGKSKVSNITPRLF